MYTSVCEGDIPDLFTEEEVDMIVTSIRLELRGLGMLDTRENCWNFFIDRIRRQLKVFILLYAKKVHCLPHFIYYLSIDARLVTTGGPVLLTGGFHSAHTCAKVSGSGELHSHRLVPSLAPACVAVRQQNLH